MQAYQRGPQQRVLSSSPFTFSVFADSVSLAGMLAVAAKGMWLAVSLKATKPCSIILQTNTKSKGDDICA